MTVDILGRGMQGEQEADMLSGIFSLPDIDCLSTKPFADSCDSK